MSDDVLTKVKESSIYPDQLMSDISKSTLGKTFLLSLALHVLIIGITSIGFIGLCIKYDTLNPREMVQAEEAQRQKEEAAAKVEAARQEKQTPKAKPASTGTTEPDTDELSPIEQSVQEVDRALPDDSDVSFDSVDSLDE